MLEISCSSLEQNDSLGLVFTDTTGTSTNGWGNGGNINVTDINGSTHTLELQLTKVTQDNNVVYDYINLYTEFGPFTTIADLVFTISHTLLKVNGVIEDGVSSTTPIEDAIWNIQYVVDRTLAGENIFLLSIFTYNQVKVQVYDKLRQISPIYMSYDNRSKEISDSLLLYGLVKGMEASAYVALEKELLNTLDTCEKILTNGSNYTWQ